MKTLPLRGTTVRRLQALVRSLQEQITETEQELQVASAALATAMRREDELLEMKRRGP